MEINIGRQEHLESGEKPSLDALHHAIADISREVDELIRQADAEGDAIEKMYYSRLPLGLYHATRKENAGSIKAEGLHPSELMYENDQAVSLSDTIEYALMCAGITQGAAPEELTVLEITTQGLDREMAKSFLQMPNPFKPGENLHEVHYSETINPDWIHELTSEEIAELTQKETRR